MPVEIIPARPFQAPVLANLLELYSYDFSPLLDLQLGADGRYGYPALPLYWQEAQRYPFLIQVDGHWAGFALVQQGSQIFGQAGVWDMAEFFIVRAHRRRGVGRYAAQAIWTRFAGQWELRVMDRNEKALAFWGQAIADYLGRDIQPWPFQKKEKGWQVFTFESSPTPEQPSNL